MGLQYNDLIEEIARAMPEGRSRRALQARLLSKLHRRDWHDLTDQHLDPEAARTFGCGYEVGGVSTLVFLSRYEDAGRCFALVSSKGDGPLKAITTDQDLLRAFWDRVSGRGMQAEVRAVSGPSAPGTHPAPRMSGGRREPARRDG